MDCVSEFCKVDTYTLFYQHLTDVVFRKMTQDHLLFSSTANADSMTPVSHQEVKAVHFDKLLRMFADICVKN